MEESTFNPYRAPGSDVAAGMEAGSEPGDELLFTVPTVKLIALSVSTFGIYHLVWFYKNWSFFKKKESLDISPVGRTIFMLFFVYGLFRKIHEMSGEAGIKGRDSVAAMAAVFIILQLAGRLPAPYSLVSLASFIPFVVYNGMAISINESVSRGSGAKNGFNWKNWLAILLGAPLVVAALYGAFHTRF